MLTFLVVVYTVFVVVLFWAAFVLQRRGRGGKLPRAFFITGTTGVVVILLVYPLYPALVPLQIEPADPHNRFLTQMVDALGQAAAYGFVRVVDPFITAALAMVISFSFSFLIPRSGLPEDPKTALQPVIDFPKGKF